MVFRFFFCFFYQPNRIENTWTIKKKYRQQDLMEFQFSSYD